MKLRNIFRSLIAPVVIIASSSAATYTQDFTGAADGTTDLGDGSVIASNLDIVGFPVGQASVQGEELRLTEDDVNSQRASFRIPAVANSSLGWTATFDFTLFDAVGGNPPADGFSFNYGEILPQTTFSGGPTGHGNAETGMGGTVISFAVDTWQDGGQGFNIWGATGTNRINGNVLPSGVNVTGTATITWSPTSTSFTTTGLDTNASFINIPHTFVGNDSYGFSFSARTGGANEELRIDNLVITTEGDDDSDGDGLTNGYEIANGLDPDDNGLNPNNNGVPGNPDNGADGDPDMDNLTNAQERDLGTNPQDDDTDGDTLTDDVENNNGIWGGLTATGTDPLNDDSDGDTLLDAVENPDLPFIDADQPGTDPNNVDSDGDGLEDGYELDNDLNPDDNGESPNNNGVAGDPIQGAAGDPDQDTLSNAEELALGTNPRQEDTDDDGYNDNVESNTGTWVSVADTGSDPLNNDSDGDSLLDGVENPDLPYDSGNPATQPGTDPNIGDTDGDKVNDGDEVAEGRDPTVPQAPPVGYIQDFDGFPDGVADLGDGSVFNGSATIDGGRLRLTVDGGIGGSGSFMIPAIDGSENGWTASFDLTIFDSAGANQPADGFSFNYGNFALTELGSAEEGMAAAGPVTENISFEVDTWENGSVEVGVNIAEKVGGLDSDLSFTNGSILADGSTVSGPVTIVYDPVEGLSFTTEGLLTNADFENIATSFVGDPAYNFGFSARVGGANQSVFIDNLQIVLGSAPQEEDFSITSIENVIVPGAGGNPGTRSVTVTWNSSDQEVYGIYATSDLGAALIDWEELDDGVVGVAGTTSFTESGIPLGTARRFYHVRRISN